MCQMKNIRANQRKIILRAAIVLITLIATGVPVFSQNVKKGMLLISPDTACVVTFDGELLGHFSVNEVRKVPAVFGEHIVIATFWGDNVLKKTVTVTKPEQMIVRLTPPLKPSQPIFSEIVVIDTGKLTTAVVVKLYKEELELKEMADVSKLKLYLSKGADMLAMDADGWSLIHMAAYTGDTELLKVCLKNGADIDARHIKGLCVKTPLSYAIERNKPKAIFFLLRNNATYGIPDGYGKIVYGNYGWYQGFFKDGKREGKGTLCVKDSIIHEGEWKKDLAYGYGKRVYIDSNVYEGNFVNNKEQGTGVVTFGRYNAKSGSRYEGHFDRGDITGYGTLYYGNGGRYEGSMLYGKRSGKGIMYYANGARYEGSWAFDECNGYGEMLYSSGNKYVGNWSADARNGKGIYYWNDGSRYEGNWKWGGKEGKGVYYYASGAKYDGHFINDERNGNGTLYFVNGDIYEGGFKDDAINGKGIYHYINGDTYDGMFERYKRDGYGVYTIGNANPVFIANCPDCKVYKGYWKNDLKNGYGGCYDAAGNLIYEERFENDKPGPGYIQR